MRHGSLFSGIGGFDLAAEWMGWENVFHCEKDEKCQKLLKKRFPNSESLGDITETDFKKYANGIDIITGGFPCQPFSLTGKQKGSEDERFLFNYMLGAIRDIKPRWVVGENVNGLLTKKFRKTLEEIFSSLASEGYEILPVVIPASAIGADQERNRIWIIAHAKGIRRNTMVKSEKIGCSNEYSESFESFRRHCADLHLVMEPDWTKPSSGINRNDDGVPEGLDRLKQLGNAVVPQVVYQIFKAIQEYELHNRQEQTTAH